MHKVFKLSAISLLIILLPAAQCTNKPVISPENYEQYTPVMVVSNQLLSTIFVESTDGTDDGVKRLINSMQRQGLDFYRLIASDDVVIIKINCQWAERGGTNTDLIRSVIKAIVEHPGGFSGEVIVADNGQGQFGSERRGGSLSWANANSSDRKQSVMDVVRIFQAEGFRVTGVLWDDFTAVSVREFDEEDVRNGFVVEDSVHSTGLEISYPKFTTEYGTKVSFKKGIWDADSGNYNSDKLKVINMPVLKTHGLFQVTAAVKNYMGTPSDRLTGRRAHNSVGIGGMGTQMAHTRMPVINIIDMIWVGVERGPGSGYSTAAQVNKVAASMDPVALDYWVSKNILIPEVEKRTAGRGRTMSPDGTEPGTFGFWLRLSMDELHKAGIWATMDENEIFIIDNSSAL